MAKCIIVSGTRICDSSPRYRVNNRKIAKPFPTITKAIKPRVAAIAKATRDLGVDPNQAKLATSLLHIVLAASWNATKTANIADIEQSVRLMLVDELGDLDGQFTLVAY